MPKVYIADTSQGIQNAVKMIFDNIEKNSISKGDFILRIIFNWV